MLKKKKEKGEEEDIPDLKQTTFGNRRNKR
jgi:hypothetical protein